MERKKRLAHVRVRVHRRSLRLHAPPRVRFCLCPRPRLLQVLVDWHAPVVCWIVAAVAVAVAPVVPTAIVVAAVAVASAVGSLEGRGKGEREKRVRDSCVTTLSSVQVHMNKVMLIHLLLSLCCAMPDSKDVVKPFTSLHSRLAHTHALSHSIFPNTINARTILSSSIVTFLPNPFPSATNKARQTKWNLPLHSLFSSIDSALSWTGKALPRPRSVLAAGLHRQGYASTSLHAKEGSISFTGTGQYSLAHVASCKKKLVKGMMR